MSIKNRRDFLKTIGLVGVMPVWSSLASASAFGAISGGYKAAVCIALRGGNDSNNLIVPQDNTRYRQYLASRGALALAPTDNLLQIGTDGAYALHPALRNVQRLYSQNSATIVTGVGALRTPATKAQISAKEVNIPEVGNHLAGQGQWESATADPKSPQGWGGEVLDALSAQAGSLPGIISLAGNSLFMIGNNSPGYTIAQTSYYLPGLPSNFGVASASLAGEDDNSNSALVRYAAHVRGSMLGNQSVISNTLVAGPQLSTVFPTSSIGSNLNTIAKLIAGRSNVGASRQMFFCQQGGFDTHADQLSIQYSNLQQLDTALGAFYAAMQELGLANQVLLFTISDFNRTYQANTGAGTDHGWAGHQIIVGGNGGRVLGTMSDGVMGGNSDLNGLGIWIPTTSSVQFAAGVAGWLGVSAQQVSSIFPDLSNFSAGALSI